LKPALIDKKIKVPIRIEIKSWTNGKGQKQVTINF